MKSIRFLAAARRELLAEVLYYNDLEAGLGACRVTPLRCKIVLLC